MEKVHPEQRDGEIYLGNFDPEQFANIGWKTKRTGIKAFCLNGDPYPFHEEYEVRPVFVQESEVEKP